MVFGIIGWLLTGVVVGFFASKIVNLRGDDPRLGMALGAVAGLVGGILYRLISGSAISGFNFWSLLFAALAAAAAVAVWHIVRSRRPYKQPSVRRSY